MALSTKTREWLENSFLTFANGPNWETVIVPMGPKYFLDRLCQTPKAEPDVVREMRENEAEVLRIMAPYYGMY